LIFIAFITIGGSIIKVTFVYDIGINMFIVHSALHFAYLYILDIALRNLN